MAEPLESANFEDSFIPILNDHASVERDVLNSSDNMNFEQEMMMVDQIISETNASMQEETQEITNEQIMPTEDILEEAKVVEDEVGQIVESPSLGPSTQETYTFKCIFCDQILTSSDEPKLLECLHNSCSNCLNNKLYEQSIGVTEHNVIECPLCMVPCRADKIIDNQFLLEPNLDDSASKLAELKCSSCSDESIATSWCMECSEFICDSCVQAHQRLKITKDHTIKPKEEGVLENQASTSNSNLFCNVHPHEKLSLFCENCDKLTCRDCQLIEHREHRYKFTNEIAADARKYIGDMLKDVGYKRVLLNSAMKVIDDRQGLITEKKQALVKEITQLVVKLTNTINVRGKQLVSKLTEVCDSKQKTLQEKKMALEQLSKMTDYCIHFTEHALDNGSDMALLYSKKQVTEHLKRIKCKRADIPNPEIPVRIHLALDKVPDLVKVMSTIGQIVVDGRIYSSHQESGPSPTALQPPGGSPSPQNHPPQQQSPISQILQQQQQPPQAQNFHPNRSPVFRQFLNHDGFGNAAMPPLGGLQQSMRNFQQQQQNVGQLQIRGPNMGPPAAVPTSLQQSMLSQQQQMGKMTQMGFRMAQMQQQRAIMPRMTSQHQQQVSSSTHPQGMLQDRSALRGLLQPSNNPVYVQTGPAQYQAINNQITPTFNRFPIAQNPQLRLQHSAPMNSRMFTGNNNCVQPQQQQQHNMQGGMIVQTNGNRMPLVNQMQQPQQQQQIRANFAMQGGGAKWHIPQQVAPIANAANNRNMTLPTINDNFKITLKQQNYDSRNPSATVTSTIPKTPSPNHIQGKSDTERNLDKCCEDSVKDLMATIAKLDSNGVQVLAEGRQKNAGSPHVDSSTGDAGPARKIKPECTETGKDDPNEDWCAVCMDGGELVCCDKCPKVFHQYCHIPNLSVEETGDMWQCLLCMNFSDIPDDAFGGRKDGELSGKERKIAERLVLELYCQYDQSLPFREIIGHENIDYHAIIKNPIALDVIRQKLKWDSPDHYTTLEELVREVRLIFKNAYTYNSVESLVYNDAKGLEKFFDEQLEKFLPEYAYENFNDDELLPPSRKYRRVISD